MPNRQSYHSCSQHMFITDIPNAELNDYLEAKRNNQKAAETMEFTFPNYYKEFSCIAGSCNRIPAVQDSRLLLTIKPWRNISISKVFSQSTAQRYRLEGTCLPPVQPTVCVSWTKKNLWYLQKQVRKCFATPAELSTTHWRIEGPAWDFLCPFLPGSSKNSAVSERKSSFCYHRKGSRWRNLWWFWFFLFTALMDTRDLR